MFDDVDIPSGSAASAGGKKVAIQLGEKTEIVFAKPIALAEIKPGDFLGVTARKRADGVLTAYEVRRFPRPINPGHRPFDGREDQTMTNAAVAATVASTDGRELTLSFAIVFLRACLAWQKNQRRSHG